MSEKQSDQRQSAAGSRTTTEVRRLIAVLEDALAGTGHPGPQVVCEVV